MPPSYVSLGDEDEAVSYAAQFLRTWRSSAGAIPWLRKTLKVPLPQPPKPRKPAWSLFRHAFLRLPQVAGEVWQLDVCRLPLSPTDGKTYRPPWALVLWNRTEDTILTFEAGDAQPTRGRGLGRADRGPVASSLRRTAPAGGDPGAAQDLPQGLAGKTPPDRHPLPTLRRVGRTGPRAGKSAAGLDQRAAVPRRTGNPGFGRSRRTGLFAAEHGRVVAGRRPPPARLAGAGRRIAASLGVAGHQPRRAYGADPEPHHGSAARRRGSGRTSSTPSTAR